MNKITFFNIFIIIGIFLMILPLLVFAFKANILGGLFVMGILMIISGLILLNEFSNI